MLSNSFMCSSTSSESENNALGLDIPRVERIVEDEDEAYYIPSYFNDNALGLDIPRVERCIDNHDGVFPHELWKQPKGGLCLLYAVLNAFNSIEDCHRFLGHPELIKEPHVTFEECRNFLDFADAVNEQWYGEGLTFYSIVEWIKMYQYELGIKDGWIVKRTKMKLNHLLLSMKDEQSKNYVIFGDAATDDILLKAAKNRFSGMKRGRKRRFAEFSGKVFDVLYHQFAEKNELHSRVANRIAKIDRTSHAVTVKFDHKGIPFLYDPGKHIVKRFFPTVRDGKIITEAELSKSVNTFIDSLILTDKIYKVDIQFEK